MTLRPLSWIALALLGALFAVGVVHLFLLRFARGDVYPALSTLRSDPEGAKVVYEALAELPGVTVERSLHALPSGSGPGTTLFYLGLTPGGLARIDENEFEAWNQFVREGGRLVLALDGNIVPEKPQDKKKEEKDGEKAASAEKKEEAPAESPAKDGNASPVEAEAKKEDAKPDVNPPEKPEQKPEQKAEKKKEPPPFSLLREWKFSVVPPAEDGKETVAASSVTDTGLSPLLPWHGRSRLAVEASDAARWRTIYAVGGEPVCLERRIGRGEIVLLADSTPFLNEAMAKRPEKGLLLWLARGGTPGRLVFDETHHGVAERPGIASLGRRYHLEGLAAGLILLALLFVWRNAVSFSPPRQEDVALSKADAEASGRDAATGLANLLGRRLAGDERAFLDTCLDEWERSFVKASGQAGDARTRLAEARAYLDARSVGLKLPGRKAEVYATLASILSVRR